MVETGRPLGWPERRAIAIGVAKGLCHLHHGCNKPVVHHNISPNNVLLDHTFKPVIAGFDAVQMYMAGLGQPLPITDLPPGKFGYAAQNMGTRQPYDGEGRHLHSYSLGVLLLVLVMGRESSGAGLDGHLAVWARNFTEVMENQPEIFKGVVDIVIPDQARYMEEMVKAQVLPE